jgi:hypothetical protein
MTYLHHSFEVYPQRLSALVCLPSVLTTYNEDIFTLNAELLEGSGDTLANLDLVLVASLHRTVSIFYLPLFSSPNTRLGVQKVCTYILARS